MKIAIVVSSLRKAGPIVVVQHLIRNFNRKDHEIVIVKLMADEAGRSITQEFVDDGVKVYDFNSSKLKIELLTPLERRRFKKLIDEIKPDIIHTHGYQAVLLASAIKNIPIVETIHNVPEEDFIYTFGTLMGNYVLLRYYSAMKKLTAAAAISEEVRNKNLQRLPEMYIKRIYNGVKSPGVKYNTKSEAREAMNVSEETTAFITIGSLLPRKDPVTTIRAFKKAFPRKDEKVELWFLGKGSLREECLKEIDGDERIKLLGWQPNVYEYLIAADYSISASHAEGFGLNYMESVFMGVPVIGTNIPVFQEFTTYFPELKQFEFKAGDSDELAERLKLAVNTRVDMEQYKQLAYDTFSAETMAKEYENFYKSVIEKQA